MANIGKLALILSADSTSLRKDFDRGLKDAQAFKSSIEKALTFATSVPGVAGIAGGILGAFSVDKIKEHLDGIVALNKEATKLGLTIKEMSGLMNVGGFDSEQFAHGLKHLSQAMVEAAIDPAGDIAKKFRTLGLDPESMLKGGPMVGVFAFADKIKSLSGAERIFASSLLGKGGFELIPFLAKGSEGIQGELNKAEKKGLVLTEDDARVAKEAKGIWVDIGRQATAVGNQISLFVARLTKGVTRGVTAGDWSTSSFLRTFDPLPVTAAEKGEKLAQSAADPLNLAREAAMDRFHEDFRKRVEGQEKLIKSDNAALAAAALGHAANILGQPIALPSAAEFGSSAALDAIARASQPAMDQAEAAKEGVTAALAERNWKTDLAGAIARAMEDQAPKVGVFD